MSQNRRRRLFVEPRMQGLLVVKVLMYWVTSFLTIGLLLTVWSMFTDHPRHSNELIASMWTRLGPALVASLVLLPLIVMDCIRWSNRYAGPMVRLHAALTKLADGQPVAPLKFRQGDLWSEMAEQFNRIAEKMHAEAPAAGPELHEDEWADEDAVLSA